MSKPIIKIHDVETNEVIEREMTDTEFSEWELDQAKAQADKIAKAETAATKAAEKTALLERLGITQEEAALLLGAN